MRESFRQSLLSPLPNFVTNATQHNFGDVLFNQIRIYRHKTELPSNPDVDVAIRAIVVAYHFDLAMP